MQGKLSKNAQLIHIDYHTDFQHPEMAFRQLLTPDEIQSLIIRKKIENDSFIIPAISMGIVKDVAFCCCPDRCYPTGNFDNYISPVAIVEHLDKYIEMVALSQNIRELCHNITTNNIILDIDLDYFLEPNGEKKFISKREDVIRREVKAINKLFEFASITTIATTPQLVRNHRELIIKKVFSESFAVNLDFFRQPPVLCR